MRLRQKTDGLLNFTDYKQVGYRVLYGIILIFLLLVVFISIFPLLWLLLSSFKTAQELYSLPFRLFPNRFDLVKLKEVWVYLDFMKYVWNSIIVVIGAVISSVLFNGLLAYGISVLKPKGHHLIYVIILGSMLIPATTAMVPLYKNINEIYFFIEDTFGIDRGILTFVPLWLIAGANPFHFLLFKAYFDRLPKELFEAAEMDGASKLQSFFQVLLPMAKPIMMVVAIFTINATWSDFLLPYLILQDPAYQTVMVKIYSIQASMGTLMNFGPDKLLTVLLFSVIPPITLFILFQRQITSSVATTGIKE